MFNPYKRTHEQVTASRLSRNGVPARYKQAALSDCNESRLDALYPSKGVLLVGSVGTGKTYMGAAVVNHWCEYGEALYTTQLDMSRDIIENGPDRYKAVEFLFIDELGRSFGTKGENDRFFDVVNYRYNHLLPTGFATNLKGDELRDTIGAAALDRIKEDSIMIILSGESRRGRK